MNPFPQWVSRRRSEHEQGLAASPWISFLVKPASTQRGERISSEEQSLFSV